MPDDHSPTDHADGGTSETVSDVPGLNRIGVMMDDLGKSNQANQRAALYDMVEAAKLAVIVTDVHGLKGADYVQFICSHLPIEAKTTLAKERAAYELRLLGYGQPANGDLIIQECEAQAKLRPYNFEWPHWRVVTRRLRKAAQEAEQGDGIPTADLKEDATDTEDVDPESDDADDTDPDADTAPDTPERPVDRVAQMDFENQKLRAELNAAQQSYRSERSAREEAQDALHRLRSDILRLLSESSEKALWNTPEPPPPEPSPEPPPDDVVVQLFPDPSLEALPPEEPPPPDPEPPPDVYDAIALIYRRRQTETCETVAAALRSVPMQEWERDDFDQLKEELDDVADWDGDHNDMAHTLFLFEEAPIVFGTKDGVLIFEDGLKVLTWPEAMQRIAPEVERDKRRRELEQRQKLMDAIIRTKLPAKRKLKATKALLNEFMALAPTTIHPEIERAVIFIGDMTKDDERFAACRTFEDYLRRAAEVTAPLPNCQ